MTMLATMSQDKNCGNVRTVCTTFLYRFIFSSFISRRQDNGDGDLKDQAPSVNP